MSVRRIALLPARFCLSLAAALLLAPLAGPARCQSLVTSRAALSSGDRVDWAVLGDRATRISDPFSLLSSQGTAVTVSEAGHGLSDQYGGLFATLPQAGSPLAEGTLNGNFAPGDAVLDAMDGGTVSLTFPRGVYGGGAQLAVPTPTASGAGAFTVRVQAFGQDGAQLASFIRGGTFSAKGDNSAPFLGIIDTSPDIYRISYAGVTSHYSLFLNRFDIATAPAAPPVSHAHILWTNPDGRATLWLVNPDGSFSISQAYGPYSDSGSAPATVPTGPGGGVWKAVALATGPDGVSRILWDSPSGRATLWHVNPDGTFGSSQAYGPYVDGGGTWQAVALSVGPDNVAHILWRNPDGRATLWFVNLDGSFGTSPAYGPFRDAGGLWQAVALATGPDGVSRILWRNPDGRATLWHVYLDGSTDTSPPYGPYTDGGGMWQAMAVSVGPDNVAHILWHNPDGRATLWHVYADGSTDTSQPYGPYADAGGLWQAVAVATGPDNVARVLWRYPDGRATLWHVYADGTTDTSAPYGPYTDAGGTWQAVADSAGP